MVKFFKESITLEDLGLTDDDVNRVHEYMDLEVMPMRSLTGNIFLKNVRSIQVRLLLRYFHLKQIETETLNCVQSEINQLLYNYIYKSEKLLKYTIPSLKDKCKAYEDPDDEDIILISDLLKDYRQIMIDLVDLETSHTCLIKAHNRCKNSK